MVLRANKNSSIFQEIKNTKAQKGLISHPRSLSWPPVIHPPRPPKYALSASSTKATRYPDHVSANSIIKNRHNPAPGPESPSIPATREAEKHFH
uniref:Uncharacterized protein n=1 Tax=Pongo abelii TaxID=9601 RepID=A0A8I5TWP3_PONAB